MVHPGGQGAKMAQSGLNQARPPRSTEPSLPGFPGFPLQYADHLNITAADIQASLLNLLSSEKQIDGKNLVNKLRAAVNENHELKETLNQNNLAMKQQFSLLVRWSQQMEEHRKQLSQRLQDAVQTIRLVQRENGLLQSSLSEASASSKASSKVQELMEALNSLNQRLMSTQANLEAAVSEKDDFFCQRTRLEGDITMLKCDLTSARSEGERLKAQRQELLSTIQDLHVALRTQRERNTSQVTSPPKEDVGMTKLDITVLREQLQKALQSNSSLQQELQESNNEIDALQVELTRSQELIYVYKARLEASQRAADKVEDASAAPKADKEDGEKRELRNANAVLKDEVETLEKALVDEKRTSQEERLAVSRMRAELGRLRKELEEERGKEERQQNTDQYYQAKIKSILERHDESTAKIISYEELLAARNAEIAVLKKNVATAKAQLLEMKSEGETIAILRAQVEVYQADFRAEREAREALATDREKLRDELRHLHARYTQLVDEMEAYQRRHLPQPSRSPRGFSEERASMRRHSNEDASWERISVTSEKDEEDESQRKTEESRILVLDENLFYCPKCNKSFQELRPLEEHVNMCLDED